MDQIPTLVEGIILAVCLWVLRGQHVVAVRMEGIVTAIKGKPDRSEVLDRIAKSQNVLRNELQTHILDRKAHNGG
jgi:hypothetical protein